MASEFFTILKQGSDEYTVLEEYMQRLEPGDSDALVRHTIILYFDDHMRTCDYITS